MGVVLFKRINNNWYVSLCKNGQWSNIDHEDDHEDDDGVGDDVGVGDDDGVEDEDVAS